MSTEEETTPPAPEELPLPDGSSDVAPAAPKKKRGRPLGSKDSKPSTAKRGRPAGGSKKAALQTDLTGFVSMVGMSIGTAGMMGGNEHLAYDGQIIVMNAEPLAAAWVDLAQKYPAVERALTMMCAAGNASSVLTVTLAVAAPIAANHGLAPREWAESFGAPLPPERKPTLHAVPDLPAEPADEDDTPAAPTPESYTPPTVK